MSLDETREPSEAQQQLPWLLVAVMVALDLVLNPRNDQFPHLNAASYVGFCMGQIAVVSAWLIFGRLYFLLRLVGVLGAIGCFSYLVAARTRPDPAEMMAALGLFVTAIAIPALILRIRGVHIGTANSQDSGAGEDRHWQFSIAALFLATTSVGLILSAANWARFPWHQAGTIVGYCSGFALVAGLSFTAMHWRDRFTARFVAYLPLVILIGYGLGQLERAQLDWRPDFVLASVVIALTEFVAIVAVIAVIRISGYQFERDRSTQVGMRRIWARSRGA